MKIGNNVSFKGYSSPPDTSNIGYFVFSSGLFHLLKLLIISDNYSLRTLKYIFDKKIVIQANQLKPMILMLKKSQKSNIKILIMVLKVFEC